jgi:hypothetical protein
MNRSWLCFALGRLHTRVVGRHRALGKLLLEVGGELLDGLAGITVHDATSRLRREKAQQRGVFVGIAFEVLSLVGKVGAVEAGHVNLGCAQAEQSSNVFAHLRRGCGGECHGGGRAQLLAHLSEAKIFGTEIVSPET